MEVGESMRHMVDPRQSWLIDPAETMFSPMVLKRLRNGWTGVFRRVLLHLMPAGELGRHFHPILGCPTKELYAMAGAIFLKEYFDLTIEQAVERCLFDSQWHYALNQRPTEVGMSHATIERYSALVVEDGLAGTIFQDVTGALIEALGLDVSRQRLDSTHIESDMATFGRTRLMAVTVKRFLVQLKRHEAELYAALPADLRERYAPSESQMFGRYRGDRCAMRQTLAEDLLALVSRFADHKDVASRSSYQAIARVLSEQCEVIEETARVKKQHGGEALQNPSDGDATYGGHKGAGYSAQIAQTCVEGNDAQLITGVEVTPAHASDQTAVTPMLEQLAQQGRRPEALYADTGYGRDENVQEAQRRGVDLQSPVGGQAPSDPGALTLDDFVIDEATETVERCPNGCVPVSSQADPATGRTRTVMRTEDCQACTFRSQCPVHRAGRESVLIHRPHERRCAERRAEQATDAFAEHYAIRAGIESTNSALKRTTGLGRLRTRGLRRVRMGVLLRCAGWNLKRAAAALRNRARRAGTDLRAALKTLRKPGQTAGAFRIAAPTLGRGASRPWRPWRMTENLAAA
jgi:IS5 family transposase